MACHGSVNKVNKSNTFVQVQQPAVLIDPKIMLAASTLMSINVKENNNRQCAAAITSALFHLMIGTNCPPPANSIVNAHSTPVVTTALKLQQALSEKANTNFATLAKAVKYFRPALPSSLQRRLDALNKAASYDRHNVLADDLLVKDVMEFLSKDLNLKGDVPVDCPRAVTVPVTSSPVEAEPLKKKEAKGTSEPKAKTATTDASVQTFLSGPRLPSDKVNDKPTLLEDPTLVIKEVVNEPVCDPPGSTSHGSASLTVWPSGLVTGRAKPVS
eukprot:TRINITY_DN9914_c0_g1_i1.p1 TRINITY_DN9914_c0_g1~~TRINITY_DN9914_c0_g1_i1.p1  ORF type:complete len:272 (-),score=65.41 TRINITY_DN9914_c0_g1_i1:177-992(-)